MLSSSKDFLTFSFLILEISFLYLLFVALSKTFSLKTPSLPSKETNFNFNVKISKRKYVSMIKNRYMSCLLSLSKKEIEKGIDEINLNFENQLNFTDTLKCISFRK